MNVVEWYCIRTHITHDQLYQMYKEIAAVFDVPRPLVVTVTVPQSSVIFASLSDAGNELAAHRAVVCS